MTEHLLRLWPQPAGEVPLRGAYLAHDLHQRGSERPFVYGNFVTSIDGRIAVAEEGADPRVPPQVANDRDWRLFQELATQADIIISSGRYLRDWAAGDAQELLQIDDPRFADLRAWREQRGLKPQPDIAILSRSLRFPIPKLLTAGGRKAIIFTDSHYEPSRVAEIEKQAGPVVVAGESAVQGDRMVAELQRRGYRTVYSAAGPQIMHMLLSSHVLDRLYVTIAGRLLGGGQFDTLLEGPLLEPAAGMVLNTVYLDRFGLDGLGQLFLSYDAWK